MNWIKLFDNFNDEDYIESSIKDILVELVDIGMEISVKYYRVGNSNSTKGTQPGVTIEIGGKYLDDFPDIYESFKLSTIKDYVDTIIDFIKEVWPNFTVYYDQYATNEAHLKGSKTLTKYNTEIGLLTIQIYKDKEEYRIRR